MFVLFIVLPINSVFVVPIGYGFTFAHNSFLEIHNVFGLLGTYNFVDLQFKTIL